MKKVGLNRKLGKALRGKSAGFTLIEVLIALALFAIIAIVFAGGLSTASRAVTIADIRTRAESLARTQMESIKDQDYVEASGPTWQAAYQKISISGVTGTTGPYYICSVNRTDLNKAVNCTITDGVIAIPWNSGNNTPASSDTGLQKITLIIKHEDREIITLEGYKVYR